MDADGFDEMFRSALAETGAVPDESHRAVESAPDDWPLALQRLHTVAGNHPLNHQHHRLLPPTRTHHSGTRLIFAEENQQVVVWALDLDASDDDPPVWQGQQQADESYVWHSEEKRLTEFMQGWWTWVSSLDE